MNIKKNIGAVTQFTTALHLLQLSSSDGGIVMSLIKFAGISQRKVAFSIRSIFDHSCLVFKYCAFILDLVLRIENFNLFKNVFLELLEC